MTEACDLPATVLLARFADRSLSPVEVLRSVRSRVAAADGQLAAMWALDWDGAQAAALASESRWRAGTPCGALDGVPITIKEMIATAGVPRPVGTAAGDMTPMAADAPPAARVREAGAVIFGKTTNPDLGMLSSGLSSFHRLARNPWDITRTPGGSSAGAGAAAAAGYGPLHLGTDIGGSLRLPAGWCGIVTLKPSAGRVPIDPPYFGRVAGPMTRTVADAALLMEVLAQADARDFMSLPPQPIDWRNLHCDVAGLRIGLQLDAGCGTPASAATLSAVTAAAHLLEAAGAIVEPFAPVMTRAMLDGLDRFWRMRALIETSTLPPERYALLLPYIREWLEAARGYDGAAVFTGFDQIMRIREAGAAAFRPYDFVISPVAPDTAFPAAQASPLDDPARPFEHIGFTVPWNMTGQPAAAIDCGHDADGLPIGLQIVGHRFDDLGVLQLAAVHERLRGPQRPWPRPWEAAR